MALIKHCLNCGNEYDYHTQGAICPHRLRSDGGIDSVLPHQVKDHQTDRRVFYGPHPCARCGAVIVKAANEDGGQEYDYPQEPIYPNTIWMNHQCAVDTRTPEQKRIDAASYAEMERENARHPDIRNKE